MFSSMSLIYWTNKSCNLKKCHTLCQLKPGTSASARCGYLRELSRWLMYMSQKNSTCKSSAFFCIYIILYLTQRWEMCCKLSPSSLHKHLCRNSNANHSSWHVKWDIGYVIEHIKDAIKKEEEIQNECHKLCQMKHGSQLIHLIYAISLSCH